MPLAMPYKDINFSRLLIMMGWNLSGFDSAGACAGEIDNPAEVSTIVSHASAILFTITKASVYLFVTQDLP